MRVYQSQRLASERATSAWSPLRRPWAVQVCWADAMTSHLDGKGMFWESTRCVQVPPFSASKDCVDFSYDH